ncbi:MAG: zf-HC2 domain-containing protein [Pyrinomonadaceae bacterium]
MNKITNNSCARREELVAYLYGEAQSAQASAFERHLENCAACRDELTAFAFVREGVGEWRADLLKGAPSLSLAGALALPSSQLATARPERDWRRAFAALREFFTLSPVWLQAGTVAAALVICALAALAVVRAEVRWDESGIAVNTHSGSMQQRPASVTPIPPAPVERIYTQQEIEQLTAQLSAANQQLEETRTQLQTAQQRVARAERQKDSASVIRNATAKNEPTRKRRAPRHEEAQLKRNLNTDDEELPTLLDLFGETD